MPRIHLVSVFCLCASLLGSTPARGADPQDPSPAQKVPVIDGAAGSCSLDLTVTADGKPAYAAKVKVHIAYGFGGFHKLDLEASTNVDGKVKFNGLPAKVRRGEPLEFDVTKEDWQGNVHFDPVAKCHDSQTVALAKAGSSPAK